VVFCTVIVRFIKTFWSPCTFYSISLCQYSLPFHCLFLFYSLFFSLIKPSTFITLFLPNTLSTFIQSLATVQVSGQQVTVGRIRDLCSPNSICRGPGSSVGVETGYGLDGPGIESRCGRDFPRLSRPALGPFQPPVQWVPGLSRG
jgi:hypothetical protein